MLSSKHFAALSSVTEEGNVWLQIAELIDGQSTVSLQNAHLVYSQSEILYVGNEDSPPPKDIVPGKTNPDLILTEYTVLPGLIEAHAHLFLEGSELDFDKRKTYLALPQDQLLSKARERLSNLLHLGITAIRDAGDRNNVGLTLSSEYQKGNQNDMPYIDSPGAAIHHQGRYGSFMGDPLEAFQNAEACVKSRITDGADRIKIIATGIINFKKGRVTSKPQMSAEEVTALVQSSRKHNRQTFAHASGSEGIENVIKGKVDSIEHGFFITDEQLLKLRDNNIAWIPTLTPIQKQIEHAKQLGWNDQTVDHLKRIIDTHQKTLLKAADHGVTIIAGSDAGSCGVPHGSGLLDELELMEDAGLSSIHVVNSATGTSASRLKYRDEIGSLKKGSKARFILTEHSPVQTVKNLQKEKIVVFDGALFHSHSHFS
ncbi:MAG: amidohydrolase family protein [Opitutaceae bacterium]|nr:amidohydrolase family protein [Opitutaceae bacterium]